MSCIEKCGSVVESKIQSQFSRLGTLVGKRPKQTIIGAIILTIICGAGFVRWETENRGEKLWVPQDTTAEKETDQFEALYPPSSRFNNIILSAGGKNILTKEALVDVMKVHQRIEKNVSNFEGVNSTLTDLCTKGGRSCASQFQGVCQCLMTSILRQWNYDLATLEADENILLTAQGYGNQEDIESVLGAAVFDESGTLVSAEAVSISYFLQDRAVVVDGTEEDPLNEAWEENVFLNVAENVEAASENRITSEYFAGRSFSDEFGGAISGDLLLVQISFIATFLFLGANMGKLKCGPGSRWTMSFAALVVVGISISAGFSISSAFGLFFGPVHSLLPFILLGIGVDDAFVIVNAFNRERNVPRSQEDNDSIVKRTSRSLARAGASITVTSLTDLVAFAISSSSGLPALASFCAYASICIFFLWLFASTFFSACLVLDERRQRDNRREFLCCLTRKKEIEEEDDNIFEEGFVSRYFRKYHAPAILSPVGKALTLLIFAGLVGFGFYGTLNLSVEDSQRSFVPSGSYLNDYLSATDQYFPSEGVDLFFVFEGQSAIYDSRQELAELDSRLSGKSQSPPYIAEPVSEEAYRNVMTGLYDYLVINGSEGLGNVTLGEDGWPTNEDDFIDLLESYTSFSSPGAVYARDLSMSEDGTLQAIRVKSEYVRLTKNNNGDVIDDADRQIEAMDATRDMVASWSDLPPAFPYSAKFLTVEGFKIIKRELFQNVILALVAVGIIVLVTVASPVTALLITVAVGCCIVEILGFMYALGIVIDSVSVINITLAVGLSVDYSAHVSRILDVFSSTDLISNRLMLRRSDIAS